MTNRRPPLFSQPFTMPTLRRLARQALPFTFIGIVGCSASDPGGSAGDSNDPRANAIDTLTGSAGKN